MYTPSDIVRSFELVDRLWQDVLDMSNVIDRELEELIADKHSPYRSAGDTSEDWAYGLTDHIISAWAKSFPIKKLGKGNSNPSAWISYQISLFGDGVPCYRDKDSLIPVGPVIHISLWDADVSFENFYCVAFRSFEWAPFTLEDERLIRFPDEKFTLEGGMWTYTLNLLEINSPESIRKLIVDPIKALIKGKSAKAAFGENVKPIICYREETMDKVKSLVAANPIG